MYYRIRDDKDVDDEISSTSDVYCNHTDVNSERIRVRPCHEVNKGYGLATCVVLVWCGITTALAG